MGKIEPNRTLTTEHRIMLYQTAVSHFTNETQLIWLRYSGFLVIDGFISAGYFQIISSNAEQGLLEKLGQENVLIVALIFGIVINSMWHILNYSGWHNQLLWLGRAARILPEAVNKKLTTRSFRKVSGVPRGPIYQIAQAVPVVANIVCIFAISEQIYLYSDIYTGMAARVLTPSFISLSIIIALDKFEKYIISKGYSLDIHA